MIEVIVSESDHDRMVEVAPGGRIVVKLPENLSTGYQWVVDPHEDAVLKLSNDTYQPPAITVPGAGGIRIFEFRAQSVGTTFIRARLRRPWESEDAQKIFEVTVHVRTGAGSEE